MKRLFYTLIFAFVGMTAWAQGTDTEATLTEQGTATGIFQTFYFGERDMEHIPVAYEKYDNGDIVLKGFAHGTDLKVTLAGMDEYGRYSIAIPNIRGIGSNGTYTYEGYEYYPFPVFKFITPIELGEDKVECIFLDGSSYYDPAKDYLCLDYISALEEEEEYMFYVEFTMPFEGETEGIEEHSIDAEKASKGIYNINGMRLEAPQKGINIIKGKKVLF